MARTLFRPTQIIDLAKMGDGAHFSIIRAFKNEDGSVDQQMLTTDGFWLSCGEGAISDASTIFSVIHDSPRIVPLAKTGQADRFMIVRTVRNIFDIPILQALQVEGGWADRTPGFVANPGEIFSEVVA